MKSLLFLIASLLTTSLHAALFTNEQGIVYSDLVFRSTGTGTITMAAKPLVPPTPPMPPLPSQTMTPPTNRPGVHRRTRIHHLTNIVAHPMAEGGILMLTNIVQVPVVEVVVDPVPRYYYGFRHDGVLVCFGRFKSDADFHNSSFGAGASPNFTDCWNNVFSSTEILPPLRSVWWFIPGFHHRTNELSPPAFIAPEEVIESPMPPMPGAPPPATATNAWTTNPNLRMAIEILNRTNVLVLTGLTNNTTISNTVTIGISPTRMAAVRFPTELGKFYKCQASDDAKQTWFDGPIVAGTGHSITNYEMPVKTSRIYRVVENPTL